MKKETKIICGSVLAFLIILFGIVAIIIHQSPQIQRETHPTDITCLLYTSPSPRDCS